MLQNPLDNDDNADANDANAHAATTTTTTTSSRNVVAFLLGRRRRLVDSCPIRVTPAASTAPAATPSETTTATATATTTTTTLLSATDTHLRTLLSANSAEADGGGGGGGVATNAPPSRGLEMMPLLRPLLKIALLVLLMAAAMAAMCALVGGLRRRLQRGAGWSDDEAAGKEQHAVAEDDDVGVSVAPSAEEDGDEEDDDDADEVEEEGDVAVATTSPAIIRLAPVAAADADHDELLLQRLLHNDEQLPADVAPVSKEQRRRCGRFKQQQHRQQLKQRERQWRSAGPVLLAARRRTDVAEADADDDSQDSNEDDDDEASDAEERISRQSAEFVALVLARPAAAAPAKNGDVDETREATTAIYVCVKYLIIALPSLVFLVEFDFFSVNGDEWVRPKTSAGPIVHWKWGVTRNFLVIMSNKCTCPNHSSFISNLDKSVRSVVRFLMRITYALRFIQMLFGALPNVLHILFCLSSISHRSAQDRNPAVQPPSRPQRNHRNRVKSRLPLWPPPPPQLQPQRPKRSPEQRPHQQPQRHHHHRALAIWAPVRSV